MTNICKFFYQSKCAVACAAAYNLSVRVLQKTIIHRKYMGNFCQAIAPYIKNAVRDNNFCDFCMFHKNIQPQKFGAIWF